jgi:hypothetical protein
VCLQYVAFIAWCLGTKKSSLSLLHSAEEKLFYCDFEDFLNALVKGKNVKLSLCFN